MCGLKSELDGPYNDGTYGFMCRGCGMVINNIRREKQKSSYTIK